MDGARGLSAPAKYTRGSAVNFRSRLVALPVRPPSSGFMQRLTRNVFSKPKSAATLDADSQSAASANPRLTFGAMFGLVMDLLASQDDRAVLLLLDTLASSPLAQAEFPCSHCAFQDQLADFLGKHRNVVNQHAVFVLQGYIGEQQTSYSEDSSDEESVDETSSQNATELSYPMVSSPYAAEKTAPTRNALSPLSPAQQGGPMGKSLSAPSAAEKLAHMGKFPSDMSERKANSYFRWLSRKRGMKQAAVNFSCLFSSPSASPEAAAGQFNGSPGGSEDASPCREWRVQSPLAGRHLAPDARARATGARPSAQGARARSSEDGFPPQRAQAPGRPCMHARSGKESCKLELPRGPPDLGMEEKRDLLRSATMDSDEFRRTSTDPFFLRS